MTYSTASSPKISIHAPTWGATGDYQESGTITYDFNPRTHMGCDGIKYCVIMSIVIFQSTHPHGVRPPCGPRWTMPWRYFNPRTHMGCDDRGAAYCRPSANFNPRTHMGCDWRIVSALVYNLRISIHAPTWGATPREWSCPCQRLYFNPRTHMGCDGPVRIQLSLTSLNFNPRTHMGCDYYSSIGECLRQYFNPRTHMGCDITGRKRED